MEQSQFTHHPPPHQPPPPPRGNTLVTNVTEGFTPVADGMKGMPQSQMGGVRTGRARGEALRVKGLRQPLRQPLPGSLLRQPLPVSPCLPVSLCPSLCPPLCPSCLPVLLGSLGLGLRGFGLRGAGSFQIRVSTYCVSALACGILSPRLGYPSRNKTNEMKHESETVTLADVLLYVLLIAGLGLGLAYAF